MFTIVSCFEVALRNAIDRKLTENLGEEWLKDSITGNGIFTQPILRKTRDIITFAHRKLQQTHSYSHPKLLAEMEFGIWKYMFRQYSIVLQVGIFCQYSPTNLAHQGKCNITSLIYLMNWIKSIHYATALHITRPFVSPLIPPLSTHRM